MLVKGITAEKRHGSRRLAMVQWASWYNKTLRFPLQNTNYVLAKSGGEVLLNGAR